MNWFTAVWISIYQQLQWFQLSVSRKLRKSLVGFIGGFFSAHNCLVMLPKPLFNLYTVCLCLLSYRNANRYAKCLIGRLEKYKQVQQVFDWDWQIVNKGLSLQQIGLARMRVRVGGARSAQRYFLFFLEKYFFYEFDKYFFVLTTYLLSLKVYLVHRHLDWQGRVSGGWSVWATAKSPWKYQERPPNIFVCHEIWWTSNPPFWWEKFWCPKILHQDLIYQKLMRFQYQPNQGIWQNQNQINSCWFWFDTKLQRESLQIYTVDGESFHVVTISREEFSNAQNHS